MPAKVVSRLASWNCTQSLYVDTFRIFSQGKLKDSVITANVPVSHFPYHSAHNRPSYSSPDIDQHEAISAFSTVKIKWSAIAKLPPALQDCRLAAWQFRCFEVQ